MGRQMEQLKREFASADGQRSRLEMEASTSGLTWIC